MGAAEELAAVVSPPEQSLVRFAERLLSGDPGRSLNGQHGRKAADR